MASNNTSKGASTSKPKKRARQSAMNVENVHDILFENDSNCSYVSSSYESIHDIDIRNTPCGTGDLEWKNNTSSFKPVRYNFDQSQCGVSNDFSIENDGDFYDYFRNFVSEELVTKLVQYTNAFHAKSVGSTVVSSCSHINRWQDIDNHTFLSFLAFSLYMPQVKKLELLTSGRQTLH